MDAKQMKIVNLNSAKHALHSLKGKQKALYLQKILENSKPDICLIPGNDPDLGLNILVRYQQFLSPTGNGPVALYDPNRISMRVSEDQIGSCHTYAGIDLNEMICPHVEVFSSHPQKHIACKFYLVSWNNAVCTGSEDNLKTQAENKVRFAQDLAMQAQEAVILAGEMYLEQGVVKNIVTQLNLERDHDFLKKMQPKYAKHKFLPSMTESVLKPERDLYMMKVYPCANYNETNGNDVFIASRKLEMCETNFLDISSIVASEKRLQPGRSTNSQATSACMQAHRPTSTNVIIAPRPPTHHGG